MTNLKRLVAVLAAAATLVEPGTAQNFESAFKTAFGLFTQAAGPIAEQTESFATGTGQEFIQAGKLKKQMVKAPHLPSDGSSTLQPERKVRRQEIGFLGTVLPHVFGNMKEAIVTVGLHDGANIIDAFGRKKKVIIASPHLPEDWSSTLEPGRDLALFGSSTLQPERKVRRLPPGGGGDPEPLSPSVSRPVENPVEHPVDPPPEPVQAPRRRRRGDLGRPEAAVNRRV